jgi:hypothetical protein
MISSAESSAIARWFMGDLLLQISLFPVNHTQYKHQKQVFFAIEQVVSGKHIALYLTILYPASVRKKWPFQMVDG